MTSWLRNKQESYSHFKGISFDESVYTLTPTITGDRLREGSRTVDMSSSLFVRDGQYNPTIAEGPMPGQKSYKFSFNSGSTPNASSRLYFGSTASNSDTGGTDDVRRLFWNYDAGSPNVQSTVYGFWIKTPTSYGLANGQTGVQRILGNTGTTLPGNIHNIAIGTSSSQPVISINHPGELTGYSATTGFTYNAAWNTWYFIAVKRDSSIVSTGAIGGTSTGTLTYTHYINGIQGAVVSVNSWKRCAATAITWGHNSVSAGTGEWSVSLAGWFVTDWDAVGQAGLVEIYKYGRVINAPVKYYDGTTWQNPTNKKVYDGTNWIDIHAAKWTGTIWDPI